MTDRNWGDVWWELERGLLAARNSDQWGDFHFGGQGNLTEEPGLALSALLENKVPKKECPAEVGQTCGADE